MKFILLFLILLMFVGSANATVNMRFLVASDGHYGIGNPDYDTDFKNIVNWSNNESNSLKGLNFEIFNGDTSTDNESNLSLVKNIYFSNLIKPYYVTVGNHDFANTSQWNDIWGYGTDYTFTSGNYVFILLASADQAGNYLSVNTGYLDTQLTTYSDKLAFVFTHVPQTKFSMHDVYTTNLENVLASHTNVAGFFTGHDHNNDLCIWKDNTYQCGDGTFGVLWGFGTPTYGYRIVEAYDNGTILTYMVDGATNTIMTGTEITQLYPKPVVCLDCLDASISVIEANKQNASNILLQINPFSAFAYNTNSITGTITPNVNKSNPYDNVSGLYTNLSLWLKLDEGTGTLANDSSGNNHNFTITSADWGSTLKYNSALHGAGNTFATSSSYTYGGDPNKISFSAWIYKTDNQTRQTIYSGSNTEQSFQIEVGGNGAGSLCAIIAGAFLACSQNDVIKNTTPTHIGYIRRGTGATHELYVNGISVPLSINVATDYVDNNVAKFLMQRDTASQRWDGVIDNIKIWNRSISATEMYNDFAISPINLTATAIISGLDRPTTMYISSGSNYVLWTGSNGNPSSNWDGINNIFSIPYTSISFPITNIGLNITNIQNGITIYSMSNNLKYNITIIENYTNDSFAFNNQIFLNNSVFGGINKTIQIFDDSGEHAWYPSDFSKTVITLFDTNNIQKTNLTINTTSNLTIIKSSLNIIPSSSSVNVTISTWQTSGNYQKTWTESSETHDITTLHTIGDFPSNTDVSVSVDGTLITAIKSDSDGYISFNYIGGYSSHVFDLTTGVSATINANRLLTCSSTRGYSDIVIPLMGLLLMILGFGTIIYTIKSGTINGVIILTAISVIIGGFGMILIGNYLLYAIYNVTC